MASATLSKGAVLVAATALLGGCSSFQQGSKEVRIREPGHRTLSDPRPAEPEIARHLQFAWLSEAAYGNTDAGLEEKAHGDDGRGDGKSAPAGCPVSQAALKDSKWEAWPGFPGGELLDSIRRYHLRIEVWKRADPPSVAVAFGGTVFDNRNDWISNLRWFIPRRLIGLDQYSATVQKFAPAFVSEFKSRAASGDPAWAFLRTARISATGHSLGGGLAQQFAYALPVDPGVPRVTHVYAFNPSPVTGYFSVDAPVRDHNKATLETERIYERGEVLALLRSVASWFVPPSAQAPKIRGVRYNLLPGNDPILGHSMKSLACAMNESLKP